MITNIRSYDTNDGLRGLSHREAKSGHEADCGATPGYTVAIDSRSGPMIGRAHDPRRDQKMDELARKYTETTRK
jgi:hypothetical protein